MKLLVFLLILCVGKISTDTEESDQLYKLDGKVSVPFQSDPDWIASTRILVDGGQYLGFVK